MFQELRIKAGLTQAQVAKEFGDKNAQFVSNCERKVAPWPVARLPKLAKLYRKPVNHLFSEFMEEKREHYWNQLRESLKK
jgi:transcriptional regulator with XRE-family HTH domain